MKHFTKEWYILEQLSYLDWQMKQAKHAERKDESTFQTFYRYRLEIYSSFERSSDLYRDPHEDLHLIDEFCNDPYITKTERKERERFRRMFLYLNRNRIETGVYFPFDPQAVRLKFEQEFQRYIHLFEHLPKHILNEIADIRMFALGYASPRVMSLLKPFCKELRINCNRIRKAAQTETTRAIQNVTQPFCLNDYNELLLNGIEKTTDGICLVFEENAKLLIQNGTISEGEEHAVIPYHPDDPESGWSKVVASELYYENNLFELHFLISDFNDRNENSVWYLTLLGSDVFQIHSSH